MKKQFQCICGSSCDQVVHTYTQRPTGESVFAFTEGNYHRVLRACEKCGHIISFHEMGQLSPELYENDYVQATYKDEAGISKNFERVIHLPDGKSDNKLRAKRVDDFFAEHANALHRDLLDIGSGLGVFVYEMKRRGWDCTALDVDTRLLDHVAARVGVPVLCGDFLSSSSLGTHCLITFNKVLEHVAEPQLFLEKARTALVPAGLVYVEVPDVRAAEAEGFGREEFFIEHIHVFSPESLAALFKRSGFKLLQLERIHEPSGKYSLFGFGTL